MRALFICRPTSASVGGTQSSDRLQLQTTVLSTRRKNRPHEKESTANPLRLLPYIGGNFGGSFW